MSVPRDGPAAGSLEKYLTELDKAERTGVLLSLMQYPKTSSFADDKPVVTAYYTCDEYSRCSFERAKKLIKESVDLKAYGSTEVRCFPSILSRCRYYIRILLAPARSRPCY